MTINSISFKLSCNHKFTLFSGGLQVKSHHSGGLQFLTGSFEKYFVISVLSQWDEAIQKSPITTILCIALIA